MQSCQNWSTSYEMFYVQSVSWSGMLDHKNTDICVHEHFFSFPPRSTWERERERYTSSMTLVSIHKTEYFVKHLQNLFVFQNYEEHGSRLAAWCHNIQQCLCWSSDRSFLSVSLVGLRPNNNLHYCWTLWKAFHNPPAQSHNSSYCLR